MTDEYGGTDLHKVIRMASIHVINIHVEGSADSQRISRDLSIDELLLMSRPLRYSRHPKVIWRSNVKKVATSQQDVGNSPTDDCLLLYGNHYISHRERGGGGYERRGWAGSISSSSSSSSGSGSGGGGINIDININIVVIITIRMNPVLSFGSNLPSLLWLIIHISGCIVITCWWITSI